MSDLNHNNQQTGIVIKSLEEIEREEAEEEHIPLPTTIISLETLLYFGLTEQRSHQIWQKWLEHGPSSDYDFGTFVRNFMKEAIIADDCDIGEPEVDWMPNLRRMGVDEKTAEGIAGQGEDFDQVRLTKSAGQWVDMAIEWRWDHLVWVDRMRAPR